jgi:hypothetical protein
MQKWDLPKSWHGLETESLCKPSEFLRLVCFLSHPFPDESVDPIRHHLYVEDPEQALLLFSSWYVVYCLLFNVSKVMLPNG